MKKLLTKVHWLCAVLLAATLLQPGLGVAQKSGGGKFTLSGTVKGDGQPLVGATVVEPGTSNGTVTGADGKFSLSLSKRGASIQVSFIGYVTKTLTANADFLEVALDSDAQKIDEVMVVAYGTMRKRDVTGSITSISSESIERRAPANVFEALQGQVAGVQISAGSGQPGESSQINIRGISTFSAEGVKPLYVVDGIPMEDIDGINPGDITSIEVLKDAASAAMYGSRSANGVILITTKGIDVGAKSEFYNMICEFAKEGLAVILISSELPEVIGLSDRIIVMRGRRIVGEISAKDATEEKLLSMAMMEET